MQETLQEEVVIETDDPFSRQIDFEALEKINPDIIGWLYIPQIEVDLPILQGQDNKVYLTKSFDGGYSPLGSVFTWAHAAEVDLIEAGILAADGKKQDTEELLCEIRQELFELKRLVADNKAEEDYPLPRL